MMEERTSTAWNYWTQKAFGANLGNWLILEWWMGNDVFKQTEFYVSDKWTLPEKDEWTLTKNVPNAAEVLKKHWDTWVTEMDFQKMAAVKVNHIRIPVGYWAFIALEEDEPYVTEGQKAQIERILGYCEKYHMHAIIDIHGLPGSQNGEEHSGKKGDKLFFTRANVNRGLETVQAVVDWMNGLDNRLKYQIAGIEAANEPRPGGRSHRDLLHDYYMKAYDIIAASPFKVPMIFHDGFLGLHHWKDFFPAPANAVLDLHPFWAFDPEKNMGYDAILEDVLGKRAKANNFHLPVIYGEWSLASGMTPSTDQWLREFVDTQVSIYQQGNAAGAIFWALKNSINNNEWSFERLVDKGIINKDTFSLHPNAKP